MASHLAYFSHASSGFEKSMVFWRIPEIDRDTQLRRRLEGVSARVQLSQLRVQTLIIGESRGEGLNGAYLLYSGIKASSCSRVTASEVMLGGVLAGRMYDFSEPWNTTVIAGRDKQQSNQEADFPLVCSLVSSPPASPPTYP